MNVREELERVPVDPEAEERAWAIVKAAYARHEPVRPSRRRWPAVVAVAAAALVAAALSPPGRAVVDAVRRTIGVEHAAPALFRLPAAGRLLVSGDGGAWVVSADGSKRRLGGWPQASWSPHALFVVGATRDELAAMEPGSGRVHWTLARRGIAFPRWGGTRTDTRVAYLSGGRLRVVAGDGTGDAAIGAASHVAPAWRPETHAVAYVRPDGAVAVVDTDSRRVLGVHAASGVRSLAWSADGAELAAVTPRGVTVWRDGTRENLPLRDVEALAFAGDGRLAVLHGRTVSVVGDGEVQSVFRAPSRPAGLEWSPNGRWLVTTLPAADQWVFLGGRRLQAVSSIARQFGGAVSLDGWAPGA